MGYWECCCDIFQCKPLFDAVNNLTVTWDITLAGFDGNGFDGNSLAYWNSTFHLTHLLSLGNSHWYDQHLIDDREQRRHIVLLNSRFGVAARAHLYWAQNDTIQIQENGWDSVCDFNVPANSFWPVVRSNSANVPPGFPTDPRVENLARND